MFWIYLLDACDSVGVWEENVILASRIIGYEYSLDTLLKDFKKQIYIFKDQRKWWISDFCLFQYGILRENSTSKPILSYIFLLKKHQLWEEYSKGIDTLKEKEQEKELVKEQEKEKKKMCDSGVTDLMVMIEFKKHKDLKIADYEYYHKKLLDWSDTKNIELEDWIAQARSFARGDKKEGKLVTLKNVYIK